MPSIAEAAGSAGAGGQALDLPPDWSQRVPEADDVRELTQLATRQRVAVLGHGGADPDQVRSEIIGTGSWTRRQVLAQDPGGAIRLWASVHDRAAGRTSIQLIVDPELPAPAADQLARTALQWLGQVARDIGADRAVAHTQLDASTLDGDQRLARWLTQAGFELTRTWLQMSRPVDPQEHFPAARAGVQVRRVSTHPDGMPVAQDVQAVHQVLEASFADHFNSYRESFAEFMQRLREDPGHRWDHWWLADIDTPQGPQLGGALVSSVLREDADGHEGSYIDYIGVHRRARGHGVAKAMLHTVIDDARERGRNRTNLEVDADSPTGADGLYAAMGWHTRYRTQSWHKEVAVGPRR